MALWSAISVLAINKAERLKFRLCRRYKIQKLNPPMRMTALRFNQDSPSASDKYLTTTCTGYLSPTQVTHRRLGRLEINQ